MFGATFWIVIKASLCFLTQTPHFREFFGNLVGAVGFGQCAVFHGLARHFIGQIQGYFVANGQRTNGHSRVFARIFNQNWVHAVFQEFDAFRGVSAKTA